jgi:peroxiredoxin Q/BCP
VTDLVTIEAGAVAPSFSAPRDGGETVSLADFAGKAVVLYFYPKDDTPGCTTEAQEFTALHERFAGANAIVIGISKDSVKKHDKFRDKHDLGVILVSDEDSDIAERYGVWKEKNMYGRTYMGIERTTFLIAPDGTVADVWRKVKPKGHAKKVLEAVEALA